MQAAVGLDAAATVLVHSLQAVCARCLALLCWLNWFVIISWGTQHVGDFVAIDSVIGTYKRYVKGTPLCSCSGAIACCTVVGSWLAAQFDQQMCFSWLAAVTKLTIQCLSCHTSGSGCRSQLRVSTTAVSVTNEEKGSPAQPCKGCLHHGCTGSVTHSTRVQFHAPADGPSQSMQCRLGSARTPASKAPCLLFNNPS